MDFNMIMAYFDVNVDYLGLYVSQLGLYQLRVFSFQLQILFEIERDSCSRLSVTDSSIFVVGEAIRIGHES
jgi:hypothetical protein